MEQQPPMQPPWEPTQQGSQSFPQPSGPFAPPPGPPSYPSQPGPPPGYYPPPGQSYPLMAPPPPPRRSRRTLWIILGIVVVVLLLCGIGGIAAIANGGKNSPNGSTSSTSTATAQPTATPTAASEADHKIGDTVNYNNEWQVTINGASFSNGDPSQFDPTPAAGQTYLVIDGTFKNLTSKAQPLSTLLYFELRDTQGNNYTETLLFSITLPDSSGIPAGGLSRGKWAYEVPTNVHAFVLTFNADLTGEPIVWDLSV